MNTAGVIPPIFASSLLMFPATMASFVHNEWVKWAADAMSPGGGIHDLVYVGLIVFFCYFYTAVTFNPVDVADNLKKVGRLCSGPAAGETHRGIYRPHPDPYHLGGRHLRVGSVRAALHSDPEVQCPLLFRGYGPVDRGRVAMDTMSQIESHLLTRHYEGFTKKRMSRVRR